ncbi:MAG: hypothetical protein WB424_14130 [Terracidiphilus sp.]
MSTKSRITFLVILVVVSACGALSAQDAVTVSAQWEGPSKISVTVPTTQHLANSFTLRSHPFHKPLLMALQNLHTDDTRLQLWFSIPRQVLPELKEPTATETFWDFTYVDPVMLDFYAHTSGIRHVNLGSIPRWMFNLPMLDVPTDPAASFYDYTKGTTGELLKDPTGKQFAEYQLRIFQWYTQSGFTDELGKFHNSGHHLKIDYWGILNEPNWENHIGVEEYTKIYDAVAEAIHKVDPKVQFFGPEVTDIDGAIVPWARYFLNPKNHSPNAPKLDWFSLHNYPVADNNPDSWHLKYFANKNDNSTDAFAEELREVIKLRDELSPDTKLAIDELGTFDVIKPGEDCGQAVEPYHAFHPRYWAASGGNWAVNFITAEQFGIPIISMTQMLGYETQSPSTTMLDWNNAKPNAHYWVLKLVAGNFGPGDKLIATQSSSPDVVAQASITPTGRKVLLVNTTNRTIAVNLSDAFKAKAVRVETVDEASGEQAPRRETVASGKIRLAPFATAVIRVAKR